MKNQSLKKTIKLVETHGIICLIRYEQEQIWVSLIFVLSNVN